MSAGSLGGRERVERGEQILHSKSQQQQLLARVQCMYAPPVCVTVMVAVDMHAARHWLGIVGNVGRHKLCFFILFYYAYKCRFSCIFIFFIMHTNAAECKLS